MKQFDGLSRCRLSLEQARKIRHEALVNLVPHRVLAARYRVPKHTIGSIVQGKTYAELRWIKPEASVR